MLLINRVKKVVVYGVLASLAASCSQNSAQSIDPVLDSAEKKEIVTKAEADPALDTAEYNRLLHYISRRDSSGRWPVKTSYPSSATVLPFKRIIAYYGNLYSKQMGVLGEYPKNEMLKKLKTEVAKWNKADSVVPAIPALHYIAVTAQ